MVVDDKRSILTNYGLKFRNWAGPGEEAADFFGLSHAVVIPLGNEASRVLISGQLGIRDDGSVPSDLKDEIIGVFEALGRALRSAGFGDDAWEHIVKVRGTFSLLFPCSSFTAILIEIMPRHYLLSFFFIWMLPNPFQNIPKSYPNLVGSCFANFPSTSLFTRSTPFKSPHQA